MFNKLRGLGHVALVIGLGLSSRVAHAACSADADSNACPLRVAGQVVFDRCFGAPPFGDDAGKQTVGGKFACNAVRDTGKLIDLLGKNANDALRKTERDYVDFVKVTTAGAIDREAIQQVQAALNVGKEIEADVGSFLADRECGRAALGNLQRKFDEAMGVLKDAGVVAGLSVEAVSKLGPIAGETHEILQELGRLSSVVGKSGSAAQRELNAVTKAITELQKEVQGLLAADFQGALSSGTALVTGVGPFVLECAACATSLGVAVQSLAGGASVSAGGGVACPETGVSCPLVAVGLPTGAAGSAIAAAIGSVPCVAASDGLGRIQEHVAAIQKFVTGMTQLATAVPKSVSQAVKAGDALARLSVELGKEGQTSVKAIQRSVADMQPALNAASGILEQKIAPKVTRIGAGFLTTFARDTALLSRCHGKLDGLMSMLGKELYDAMALLAQASSEAVDAGKIVANLQTQSVAGLNAAKSFTGRRWDALNDDYSDLHVKLWGVAPNRFDLGKTVPHLISLAGNADAVRKLAGDATELLTAEAKLAVGAVDAGKNAFLGRDQSTAQARTKYGSAKTKARAAQKSLAVLRAKATARAKARQQLTLLPNGQVLSEASAKGPELARK